MGWDLFNKLTEKADEWRNSVRYYRYYVFNRFYTGDWSYDLRPKIGVFGSSCETEARVPAVRYVAVCLYKSSVVGVPFASLAYYRACQHYRQSVKTARVSAFRLYRRFPAFGLLYGVGMASCSLAMNNPHYSPQNHLISGTVATCAFINSWKWPRIKPTDPLFVAGKGPVTFLGGAVFVGVMCAGAQILWNSDADKSRPHMYTNPLHWRGMAFYGDIDQRKANDAEYMQNLIKYQHERNEEFARKNTRSNEQTTQ